MRRTANRQRFRDRGRDLGAEAGGAHGLVHDEQLAGAPRRREHGVAVPRPEAAQVDHLHRDAVGGECLGGVEAGLQCARPRDDRQPIARPHDARLADRDRCVTIDLALDAPELLVLHVDDRIAAARAPP